jgi:uncharacterized cupredoxin-like copper-binding protein
MLVAISCPQQALTVTVALVGLSVAGCSQGPDRPRVVKAEYSTGETRAVTDTGTAEHDTSTPSPQLATKPASSAPESGAVSAASVPRPSTNPPRKSTKSVPTSSATARPSSDSAAAAAAAPASPAAQGENLRYDAASNTVTFDLIGGPSGFKFNGYASGEATLTVPSKANMVVNFVNKDGTPHSAEVISSDGPLPNAGIDAAISQAYTKELVPGLPQEGKDVMRFTVPDRGTYRIICGVPGHALSGMWIWFKVDPAAKAPSFGPTKA